MPGEELYRVAAIACALVPVARTQLRAIERMDRGGVRPPITVQVPHGSVGGVPEILRGSGPGDVTHAVGPETPGELAVGSHRGRGSRHAVGLGHHPDDSRGMPGRVQTSL